MLGTFSACAWQRTAVPKHLRLIRPLPVSGSRPPSFRPKSTKANAPKQNRAGTLPKAADVPPLSKEPPSAVPPTPKAAGKGKSKWRTRFAFLGGALVVTYVVDEFFNARTAQRNMLTAWTGVQIALDYKLNFDRNSLESINSLHERCADRLMYVCEKNQGLYVKLGQAIGVQAAILPKPYHQLSKLFDNAHKLPYEEVHKVLVTELGAEPEEIFAEFDETPIAAASVAQVHKARLKPPPGSPEGTLGQEVAVKVQRPNIRKYAKWDLWSFRVLLVLYERIFELPLAFSGQYISDQIEQETFFTSELRNAKRAKESIENDPEKIIRNTCYVPEMYEEYCTNRVLVMEWIEGACKMTDRKRLEEEMGLSVKKVSQSVCEVFASQIFQHGFVQADGHPSNVLVRKHPNGKKGDHQVVLIDHGLYVELSEELRRKYAQLWKSIFTLDLKTLDDITRGWGMGEEASELFASATLMRPWSKPKKGEEQHEGEHAHKTDLELQREMKERIKNFLVHVELLPKELIFVGRSMRIIQANNQVLGSPVNRVGILARHAAAALISPNTPSLYRVSKPIKVHSSFGQRLSEWLRDRVEYVKFRSTLLALDAAFVGSGITHWISFFLRAPIRALLGGRDSSAGGFEDDLEKSMRKMARDEFGVELDDGAFVG